MVSSFSPCISSLTFVRSASTSRFFPRELHAESTGEHPTHKRSKLPHSKPTPVWRFRASSQGAPNQTPGRRVLRVNGRRQLEHQTSPGFHLSTHRTTDNASATGDMTVHCISREWRWETTNRTGKMGALVETRSPDILLLPTPLQSSHKRLARQSLQPITNWERTRNTVRLWDRHPPTPTRSLLDRDANPPATL